MALVVLEARTIFQRHHALLRQMTALHLSHIAADPRYPAELECHPIRPSIISEEQSTLFLTSCLRTSTNAVHCTQTDRPAHQPAAHSLDGADRQKECFKHNHRVGRNREEGIQGSRNARNDLLHARLASVSVGGFVPSEELRGQRWPKREIHATNSANTISHS